MIEIEITEDMVKDATKHVLDHKDVVSKIGVHSPKFKIMGALGEEVFAKAFPNCVRSNTHDFDFITPDGRTVDVKTTSSKSMPPEFFETGTNAYNTTQRCHYYAFVYIERDFDKKLTSKGWIAGTILKEKFYKLANYRTTEELEKQTGSKFNDPMYRLAIGKIKENEDIISQG